jgi:adenylate cyclase
MTKPLRSCLASLVIGLAAAGLVLGLAWLNPATTARLQIAATDFVFLDPEGPRLGRTAPHPDIVLVLFDAHAASEMGSLPNYDQDLELYRMLLAADVRLIGDTRMIAEMGNAATSPVAKLLAAVDLLDARGRLFRDVWLPVDWPTDVIEKYRPYITHNALNMHANSDAFTASRLYPLAIALVDGVQESMPLVLARAVRGLPRLAPAEATKEMIRAGIAARWNEAFPGGTPIPAAAAEASPHPSPYWLGDHAVPWQWFPSKSSLEPPAGFWISYAAAPTEYPRVSYVDVSDHLDELRDKIVLLGYSADIDPTTDLYDSPSSTRRVTASEAVAAALETLLRESYIRAPPRWALPTLVLVVAVAAALASGLLRLWLSVGALASLLAATLGLAIGMWRSGDRPDLVLAPAACLLAGGMSLGRRHWQETRLRSRITDLFGRYVPRTVVNQLMLKPDAEALALGGVKREVTVLFADVRGFTPFSERLPPEEVIAALNSLLKIMVDATFAHGGTLDKFIGDAILVLFNAPLDQPDHALRAARTAWDIQQGVSRHASGLSVGIGIHRGEAVVGTVGTPQRMEYTAIGSTVNIASRLCAAAARGQILVSAAAGEGLDEHFRLESQPPLRVKGVDAELATSVLVAPIEAS